MNIDLSGKTALVTGSTAGIGHAIARGIAASGAAVIVHGRSAASVEHACSQLLEAVPGASIHGVAADIGSPAGVASLVEALPGSIDVLVNNAGIYGQKDFFEADDALWDSYWQTNVMSGMRLARALAPAMIARGWGRIVFVSSESARNIPATMVHYGVSKTAQLALARGLAKRLAGTGVTVNSVLPGPTLSDGLAALMKDVATRAGKTIEEVAREFVLAKRPSSVIQRAASVDEVASMVVYVCSPQASATTGAALRVDGGVVDDIV